MSTKKKTLVINLMPLGAGIGCAIFVVLSISLIVLAIASSDYLVAAVFLPALIFFGIPFYKTVDPEYVMRQRAAERKRLPEAMHTSLNEDFKATAIIITMIVAGVIAIAILVWLIGFIASLPVGVLLTIIILVLISRR